MPRIECHNIDTQLIRDISPQLTKELSLALEIPTERFSFIIPNSSIVIKEGVIVTPPISIVVHWKERPENIIFKTSEIIKNHLEGVGINDFPIYFENIFRKI